MPFSNDFVPVNFINKSVQATGTPDIDATWLNYLQSEMDQIGDGLATFSSDLETLEATVGALGNPYTDPMYISGLSVDWASTTQVSISSGACYVPATGNIASKSTSTTLAISGIAASTWYYIYAIDIGGSLSFESSTTAPVEYRGTAKQKSGDSSRRFVDCCRTNASSQIMKWAPGYPPEEKRWLENIATSPLRILTGGTATTETTLTAIAPPHSRAVLIRVVPTNGVAVDLGNADDMVALGVDLTLYGQPGNTASGVKMPLSSTQTFTYRNSAGGGATYIDSMGFYQRR